MALPPPPAPTPEKKPGTITFGSSKPANPTAANPEVMTHVSDLNRRVRIVEEGLSNIRRKFALDQETHLDDAKKVKKELSAIYSEVDEIKKHIHSFKEDMIKIIKELQGAAKKEDTQRLEKYINLWSPVTFVRQEEVENIVADAVDRALTQRIHTAKPQQTKEEPKKTENPVSFSKPTTPTVQDAQVTEEKEEVIVDNSEHEILHDKEPQEEIITSDSQEKKERKVSDKNKNSDSDEPFKKNSLDNMF